MAISQTHHAPGNYRPAEIIFYRGRASSNSGPQRASHQRNPRRNSAPVAAKKRNATKTAANIPPADPGRIRDIARPKAQDLRNIPDPAGI
jgi:hypothetical protein